MKKIDGKAFRSRQMRKEGDSFVPVHELGGFPNIGDSKHLTKTKEIS